MTATSNRGIVGLDIGGANLKYADTSGVAFSRHFEMWRQPDRLAATIRADLTARFADCATLAVTMTGELADCFVDRAEGVEHIVRHVCDAAAMVGGKTVRFYGVDGEFRTAQRASLDVDLVAAANWHALASYVGREIASDAVLIDIGSTTTDIIPIQQGRVATLATTDHDRLREGSLVYVGCRRTPVCAIVDRLRFRGQEIAVMNELFATTDDARIILGYQGESADDHDSSDSKPRTREMAANRLARMIGLDRRRVTAEDAMELAMQVHLAATRRIRDAIARIAIGKPLVVLSGHGDDLIEIPGGERVLRLADELGTELSRSAPSYAVAQLLNIANHEGVH